jgi:hypothetical protein
MVGLAPEFLTKFIAFFAGVAVAVVDDLIDEPVVRVVHFFSHGGLFVFCDEHITAHGPKKRAPHTRACEGP